jgi:LPXTG-site transpeptidase (sortase) family protein
MDNDQNPLDFQLPQGAAPPKPADDHDAAADLARAKINTIFGSNGQPQAPPAGASPAPAATQPQPPTAPAVQTPEQAGSALSPDYGTMTLPNQPIYPAPTRAEQIARHAAETSPAAQPGRRGHILRPLIKAALVTGAVFMIYNAPIVMGQVYYYITPANSQPTPVILNDGGSVGVGSEPRVIISKLNIDAPVVYDETSYDEAKVHEALKRGVVHYGTTALPGQLGNAVYLGHSSNSPWDPGRYKTIFSILRRLEVSDSLVLHYKGKRYIYEVFAKKTVDPADLSVLDQRVSEPILTLITCDPPGVNWKRLIIQARQISPNPKKSLPPGKQSAPAEIQGGIPGAPSSLFDRMRDWIF